MRRENLSLPGLVRKQTAAAAQASTDKGTTQKAGFFQFARFRMRPLASPSPNAGDIPAAMCFPVARLSRDAV